MKNEYTMIESLRSERAEKRALRISFNDGIEDIVLNGLRILSDLSAVKSTEDPCSIVK
jgi:hypothetical protein